MRLAWTLALMETACPEPQSPPRPAPEDPDRVPLTYDTDPDYATFEGMGFKYACVSDDVRHPSNCGNQMCSAEIVLGDVCRIDAEPPPGASCGCVRGECVWWRRRQGP